MATDYDAPRRNETDAIASYPGPWLADLTTADAAARWTRADTNNAQLNLVGDLDGDGLADLAVSSHTHPEPARFGAVGIVPGGDPGGGLDALPVRIDGDVQGMALGTDVSAGDLDGDGAPELVVGAAGLGAPLGGLLLAFDVPATGALTVSDAIGTLHGDRAGDDLGGGVLAVDPDGDGQSDVFACEGRVGCWLVGADALVP